ncbi:MAG: glycine zipper 2TM domain-containing protein [Pseudomonadota bacterium]
MIYTPSLRGGIVAILASLMLVLAACAPNINQNTVSLDDANRAERTEIATVISYRPVNVEGTRSGVGAIAGAAAGGTAGSLIGGGTTENILGAIGGAVAGGLAGNFLEEGLTRQTGIEYTLRQQNGQIVTVVQGAEDPIAPGTRVLIIYGERTRVVRASGV